MVCGMRILAIETSCDESAIAIAEFSGTRKHPHILVRANIVSSQVALHAKFGGVVPNLAKREHQKNLVPILLKALKESRLSEAKIKKQELRTAKPLDSKFLILDSILEREPELLKRYKKHIAPLQKPNIDAIAVTYGPGLAPSLWVGVNFARALSYIWGIPLIPTNHMAGHLYSALLQQNRVKSTKHEARNSKQKLKFKIQNDFGFPALALLVSGGHTELVLMRGYGKYKIIGETLDDAAGEAFDKVARLLGLGYPGGPEISALAEKCQVSSSKFQVVLPRPMLNSKDYNFSFSGLKTAVLYLLRDHPKLLRSKIGKAAVAKEFQNAVVDVLVAKTIRAAKEYKVKTILLGGGVAANHPLRKKLQDAARENLFHVSCFIPHASLTGDNALMIALAAFFEKKKICVNYTQLSAEARACLG